ncbi:11139_t:CDS:1, partial [Racocetra persica]
MNSVMSKNKVLFMDAEVVILQKITFDRIRFAHFHHITKEYFIEI